MAEDRDPHSDVDKTKFLKDSNYSIDWQALPLFINEIIELSKDNELSEMFHVKGKRDNELAKNTLIIAKGDFETAKLLYSNHKFPDAALYLQKAVEKLAKGYSGEELPLNEKEIYRGTSHNTPLIFLKLMQKPYLIKFLKKFEQIAPGLDTKKLDELDQIIALVKDLDSKKQTANLPVSLISDMLNICEVMMGLEDSIRDFQSINKLAGFNVESIIRTNLDDILKNYPGFKEQLKELDISSVVSDVLSDHHDRFVTMLIFLVPIFVLSIITYPHKDFTEYADKEMKPSAYTENLGIIQSFERIHNLGLRITLRLIEFQSEV